MHLKIYSLRVGPMTAGLLLAGVMCCPGLARAEDTTRPATPNGNWWDNPAQPPTPQPGAPGALAPRREAPPYSPYSNNILDYPSAQMSDWVVAQAMAARARAMKLRADSELGATIRRAQQRFERSDEYVRATAAEKQAYADYTAARQKVLNTLVVSDPKYHAISQLRDEMGDKIVTRRNARQDAADIDRWLAVRGFDRNKLSGEQMITLKAMFDGEQEKSADPDAARSEILAMATLKMQYASDARAIEVTALGSDDGLKAARDRMVEASKRVAAMRAQFEYAVHDDPEVSIARRNLQDASVAVIEAQTLAEGASYASAYALNYAYYLHRNDNGGPYGPYGPGNNGGGGYYSPYWGR